MVKTVTYSVSLPWSEIARNLDLDFMLQLAKDLHCSFADFPKLPIIISKDDSCSLTVYNIHEV